ncbi:MAG: hypothetical protein U9R23_08525 [Candidatus Cloacimonadota bacterium]|nr:hypothetical protein [Candidatus Cloacimonadota bacterium]
MENQEKIKDLCSIPGIGDKIAQLLIHSGFDSVYKLNIELNQDNFDEKKFQRRLQKNNIGSCPSIDSIMKWRESIRKKEHLYTIAEERYNSLMERSFEKALRIYHYKFKLQKVTNWSESKPNERNKLTCDDVEDFKKRLDKKELNLFPDGYKEDYEDMKKIRKRNEYFDIWSGNNKKIKAEKNISSDIINNNKKIVKKMKIEFKNYFENELNLDEFKKEIFFKDKEKDKRICYYCGISEAQIEMLANNSKIKTKRFYSRGKTMEIDQKKSENGYKKCNIVLACYWCNNAKSDEFDEDEFQPIANGIRETWNKRLSEIKEKIIIKSKDK